MSIIFSSALGSTSDADVLNNTSYYRIQIDTAMCTYYFQEGKSYCDLEDYALAIESFNKVIKICPEYNMVYFFRGGCYFYLNDFKRSLEDLLKELQKQPNNIQIINAIGQTHVRLREYKEGLFYYMKSIVLDSLNSVTLFRRAEAYACLKKYNEALLDYNKALALDPRDITTYFNRALLKSDMKDYKGALDDYNTCLLIDPFYPDPYIYYNKGMMEYMLEDYSNALNDFTIAILNNSKNFDAYYKRGNCKIKLSDYSGAIYDFTKCIEIQDDFHPYLLRAYIKFNYLKDYEGALQDYKICEKFNEPEFKAELYSQEGGVYKVIKNYAEASMAFNKSLQIKEDPSIYVELGDVKYLQQDFKAAESYYKKSIQLQPNVSAYERLASLYFMKKEDYSKSLECVSKALQLDNSNSKLHLQKGLLENSFGHSEIALTEFSKAIQLDSNNAAAYIARADLKNSDLSDLNKALNLDPSNYKALKMHGIKQYKNGNFAKAILDYNKLIEVAPDSAEPYFLRSGAELAMNDLKSAFSDINKSINLNASNPISYYNRGIIGMSNLEIYGENVLKDFNKAIELKNDYGDAYFARAKIKYTSGDKTGACSDLQESVRLKVEGAKEKWNEICK